MTLKINSILKIYLRLWIVCCACTVLASCAQRDKEPELRAAVARFHTLYNEQKFDEIYAHASLLYKRRTSPAAHTEYFSEIYRRDGRLEDTHRANTLHRHSIDFEFYVLSYSSHFENRKATEDIVFNYDLTEGGPLLAAYERE